jgi:hypothetical protein
MIIRAVRVPIGTIASIAFKPVAAVFYGLAVNDSGRDFFHRLNSLVICSPLPSIDFPRASTTRQIIASPTGTDIIGLSSYLVAFLDFWKWANNTAPTFFLRG